MSALEATFTKNEKEVQITFTIYESVVKNKTIYFWL